MWTWPHSLRRCAATCPATLRVDRAERPTVMTEERLRTILEEDLGVELDDVTRDDSLVTDGIVDSFALVDLVMQLESELAIKVKPLEINLENFDTLGLMLAFLEKKVAAKT